MAFGTLKADTLTHSTAGSLTTNFVVNGSAKAWVNFDGSGTIATRDSLNISGLVDNGTGDYTISYSNSMSAAYSYSLTNYTAQSGSAQAFNNRINGASNKLAGSVRVNVGYVSSTVGNITADDASEINQTIQGDLA